MNVTETITMLEQTITELKSLHDGSLIVGGHTLHPKIGYWGDLETPITSISVNSFDDGDVELAIIW